MKRIIHIFLLLFVLCLTAKAQQEFIKNPSILGWIEREQALMQPKRMPPIINGVADITPTGAATYAVPINCPPGIQGMQPQLSLTYNSHSRDGVAGMNWDLSGLSMISRVPKNFYHDNDRGNIIWDATSPLSLDGQRLIKLNQWGYDSVEYRTEGGIEKVIGYNISSWGPMTFKVYTKDGRTMIYGNPESMASYYPSLRMRTSIVESFFNLGTSKTESFFNLGWALCKIIDANSNFIEFIYTNDKQEYGYRTQYSNNRLAMVKYGNHSHGKEQVVGKINLHYRPRDFVSTQYVGGVEFSSNLILNEIQILGADNNLLEIYQLTHTTRDNVAFLEQIELSNTSSGPSSLLKFEWSNVNYSHKINTSVTFTATPHLTSYSQAINFTAYAYGDIDRDGLTDVLIRTNFKNGENYWIVYRNRGNGMFQYVYEHEWDKNYQHTFLFLDLDSDGKDELYVGENSHVPPGNPIAKNKVSYHLHCYKYENGALIAHPEENKSSSVASSIKGLQVVPADFLGNGTTQFILFSERYQIQGQIGLPSFDLNAFGNANKTRITLTDINGNGKTEIAYTQDKTTTFYEFQKNDESSGKFVAIHSCSFWQYESAIHTGDFNGDGNTDLLVGEYKRNTYSWKLYLSKGGYFIDPVDVAKLSGASRGMLIVMDINRDGKSDILTTYPNFKNGVASNATLTMLLSNGTDFTSKVLDSNIPLLRNFTIASKFTPAHSQDVYMNFNAAAANPYIISLNEGVWFNKIARIMAFPGDTIKFQYTECRNPYPTSSANYNNDPDLPSIISNMSPRIDVVKQVTTSSSNTTFSFAEPITQRSDRGFLGFRVIEKKDNINKTTSKTECKVEPSFGFLYPYKTTLRMSNAIISENKSNYTIVDEGNKKYFLRLENTTSTDYLKGANVTTTYTNYDADRNPQSIERDLGDGFTSRQKLTYVSKGSRLLNKISEQQIVQSAPSSPDYNQVTLFEYDNSGNLTLQAVDPDDTLGYSTTYSNYDKYGNPQKVTTTASNIARSLSMTYSESGRFVKSEKNDLPNEMITYNYNEARGLFMSQSDRFGTTSYQYDSWGRPTGTTYPNGTTVSMQLTQALLEGAAYAVLTSGQNTPSVQTYYNLQGQELHSTTQGKGNKYITTEHKYNVRGLLEKVVTPNAHGGKQEVRYEYDDYGRLTKEISPSAAIRYAYGGNTVTTTNDSTKRTHTRTTNPLGQVASTTDASGTVTYTYNALGLPTAVSVATQGQTLTTTMEYDKRGHQTKLVDPTGTTTYKYNALGELLEQTDAEGNTTATIYNEHGRPHTHTLRSPTLGSTTYTYHYSGALLDKVEQDGRSVHEYYYTPGGLLSSETEFVDAQALTHTYHYNALEQLIATTYPSGLKLSYSYDSAGYLTTIADAKAARWELPTYNSAQQLEGYTLGNGTRCSMEYTKKGLLKNASIFNPNGERMHTQAYAFNTATGNLTSRAFDGKQETFEYDHLDRLLECHSAPCLNDVVGQVDAESHTVMEYSPNGNLTSKTGVGTFAYNETSEEHTANPYAITSINTPIDTLQAQRITYNAWGKVATIAQGTDSVSISYSHQGQRNKMEHYRNSSLLRTHYYSGLFERQVEAGGASHDLLYVTAESGIFAVHEKPNQGSTSWWYLHPDHLGSPTLITDNLGQQYEQHRYDAWGNRLTPQGRFSRGYTTHEHLDAFGLINMNGRIYDPMLGRMLSPDPYVVDGKYTQDFNRYSYARNNPLIYTDPSGEFLGISMFAISLVGDYFSNLINGVQNPLQTAYANAANVTNGMSNCLQVPIYQNGGTTISLGIDPFALGVSINASHRQGGTTVGSSFSFGALGGLVGNIGASQSIGGVTLGFGMGGGSNYWGWNASAAYQGYGLGYGQTHYGNAPSSLSGGSNPQVVGSGSILFPGGSFTLQNDFLAQSGDKWRTNAWELTIGNYSIGSSIYTNDGKTASEGKMENLQSPTWGENRNPSLSAWKNGQVYSAPIWFGVRTNNRIERIGHSSRISQDLQQNFIHSRTRFGAQNYYLDYDYFRAGGYLHTGFYNPYSLWTR